MRIFKLVLQSALTRKKLLVIIGVIISVYFFKPFGLFKGNSSQEIYKSETVSYKPLSTTINASGMIETETAILSFLSSGRVAWVGAREGEEVKKGQILASLDSSEQKITISKYEAALKSAQSALDEVLDDISNSRSDKTKIDETQTQKTNREQAEMARDAAFQDLEKARKAVGWTTIIAPFDGVISEVKGLKIGQNVTPTTSMITIVAGNDLKFIANVDEVDISRLNLGQEGVVTLDAYPGETFPAEIHKIGVVASKLSTGGSVVPVELGLPADNRFKSGFNGEVEFGVTAKFRALVVPRTSLHKDDTGQFVYVMLNDKPEKRLITVGESLGGQTEVLSGINEGEKVVLGDVKK